ncbi:6412_t:CDS:10, partial [Entrophospora sp. SA101]
MGRPKNQPRIKGNVQPASSSRAAEVIAAKGNQTSVSNLGGFSQFIGASAFTNVNSAELNSDNVNDVNLDSELVIILKRLSKRDSTTKLKALDDLESYLKNKIEKDDVFVSIMDAWKLAPVLKEIIGVWIISMFDQSKDVARIANESFEAAFSPEKRIEVLIFCQSEIINFIKEIIIYKTPETLSDPRFTSKEDMNSKYARVLASSYYVLANLIEKLNEETLSKAICQYEDLFDNTKTWSNLSNDNSIVRKSCYNLIKTLVNKWPKQVENRLEMLSTTFLMKAFNEKEINTHSDLWDSLLVFTKKFPQSWIIASQKKPILPKFYNFLRSATYGSINISYPSILALIGNLPHELIDNDAKFYDDFLINFWKGLTNSSIDKANSAVFLKAYCECLVYFVVKLGKVELKKETQVNLIEKHYIHIFKVYLLDFKNGTKFQPDQMCSILASYTFQLLTKLRGTDSGDILLSKIKDLTFTNLSNGKIPNIITNQDDDFKDFCQRLGDFYISLMGTANSKNETTNQFMNNMIEKIIEEIFLLLFDKLNDFGGSIGLSLLLSHLTKNFPCIIFEKSNVIENVNKVQKNWNNLLKTILSIDNVDVKLDKIRSLIDKISKIIISMNLYDEQYNVYLIDLSKSLLDKDLDYNTRTGVEELLYDTFSSKVNIISKQTKIEIFSLFSKATADFTESYFITRNMMIYDSVISILKTFEKLFKDDQSLKVIVDHSNLIYVIGIIFQLTFIKPQDDSNSEAVVRIKSIAESCWELLVENSKLLSCHNEVSKLISLQIKSSLLNINYDASPTDFVQQVMKLCESFYKDEPSKQLEVIKPLLLNNGEWINLSEPFLSRFIGASRGIIDPIILPYPSLLNHHGKSAATKDTAATILPNIEYDLYGLTIYGRLGLVIVEIINKIGVPTFFGISISSNKEQEQKEEEKIISTGFHGILLELLLIYVLCFDIHGSHKAVHHLWDSAITEESHYHGFTAFLDDISTIVQQYAAISFHGGIFDLNKIFDNIMISNEITNDDKIFNLYSLIVDAINRSSSNHLLYWARVLRVFLSEALRHGKLTIVNIDGFLNNLKSESCSFNLEIKLAFIDSLEQYIKGSEYFEAFKIDLVNKLCRLDINERFPKVVSSSSSSPKEGWNYISLLIISGPKSNDYIFLPDEYVLKLFNSIIEWYKLSETSLYDNTEYLHINIQIAKIFYLLVPSFIKLEKNHLEITFDLLKHWFEPSNNFLLLYEALRLYNRLKNFVEHENPDQENILYEIYSSVGKPLLDNLMIIYINEKDFEELLSDEYEAYLNILSELFQESEEFQKCTYKILHRYISRRVKRISNEFEIVGTEIKLEFDEGIVFLIQKANHSNYLDNINSTDINILNEYKIFGYLLTWLIIFDYFENTTFRLKSELIAQLKEFDLTSRLFGFIFETLGFVKSTSPYDLAKWDFREFYVEGFDRGVCSEVGFPLLCANLYYRNWHAECKKRQLSIAINNYTEKHFSSSIIQQQFDTLLNDNVRYELEDDKFSIRVARSSNEVISTFNMDEYIMELSIRLPTNYPLSLAEFNTIERIGTTEVTDLKWAKLPIQTIVNSQ